MPKSGPPTMGAVTFVEAELLARAQHAVDEVLPDGVFVEVFDGVLAVNPPPSFEHALITDRLGRQLDRSAPAGLVVNWAGVGVYERDDPHAEYQVPDVVVFRAPGPRSGRLTGDDVDVVVEVVSPANRHQHDYPAAVAARATRFRIPWALVIDPDTRTAVWWRAGSRHRTGPNWAADLDLESILG